MRSNLLPNPLSPGGKVVLAVDPGRDKCGVAVVCAHPDKQPKVEHQSVVATTDLAGCLVALISQTVPDTVIVGNGTHSRAVAEVVQSALPHRPVTLVAEAYTTERARKRYLRENPARGWQRLLPPGLRTPPVPVDDYVAVILAEDYLAASGSA